MSTLCILEIIIINLGYFICCKLINLERIFNGVYFRLIFCRMITYNIPCCMNSAISTVSRTKMCRKRRLPANWRSWRSTYGRKCVKSWKLKRVPSGCEVCRPTKKRCRMWLRWWKSRICDWTRCRPIYRNWNRKLFLRMAKVPSSPARPTAIRMVI